MTPSPVKKVYFEKLSYLYYPLLIYYFLKGYRILVFDFISDLKKYGLLRRFVNEGKLERICTITNSQTHGLALDETNIIFNKFEKTPIVRLLSNLYGTDETNLAYKKCLLMEVFKYLYINAYLSKSSDGRIVFVPHSYQHYQKLLWRCGSINPHPLGHVVFQNMFAPILLLMRFFESIKWRMVVIAYVLPRIFILIGSKILRRGDSDLKRYKYTISIDQEFQIKFKGKRGFDFLLDGRDLRKDNTVFLLGYSVPVEFLKEKKSQGYNFFDFKNLLRFNVLKTMSLPFHTLFKVLMAIVKISVLPAYHFPFLKCSIYGIIHFLKWHLLFTKVSLGKFIYTNQDSFCQILANIALKTHRCTTWYYSSFIGGGLLNAKNKEEFRELRHIHWSYLNSDNYLAVNEDVLTYYRMHDQEVKKYYVIGNLYSEMIDNDLYQGRLNYMSTYFKREFFDDARIISFFDTSFVDLREGGASYDEAIEFYTDILKLLEDRKNFFAIIKPSKDVYWYMDPAGRWSSPKKGRIVVECINRLKSCANVHWAGDDGDIPTIMSVSDIVVTYCMSSPTVEALGARKKAFWYEVGDKHHDIRYDKIPRLIAHGYKQLIDNIDYFLQLDQEGHDHYLEQNIKGVLEHQLDGLALTRFRKLLSETA